MPDGAKFCTACGKKIEIASAQSAVGTGVTPPLEKF